MKTLKVIVLSPYISWLYLFLFAAGHAVLLVGQLHLDFRTWLMGQQAFFDLLFAMFLNAWVYSVALLAGINLIRVWLEQRKESRKRFRSWIKPWASLNLAVFTMLLLATLTAIGTIVESRTNLEAAQNLVYHTWWMYGALGLLCINLLAVILERIPWKDHHLSFILAHVGIILLVLGALETAKKGVDGSMNLGIGEENRFVTIAETDLSVFTSFDGDRYTQLHRQPFNIYDHNLKEDPIEVSFGDETLKVIEAVRYGVAKDAIVPSESSGAKPALRFQVNNNQVNVNEWLINDQAEAGVEYNFGPAQLYFGKPFPEKNPRENQIYLNPQPGSENIIEYQVFSRASAEVQKGQVKEGENFFLPWMGLVFRALRYIPQAERKWEITPLESPTPITTSALKVRYKDQDYWLQKNDVLKFFTEQAVFIVTYRNRRLDVGFPIKLKKFEVGRYQGTMMAASYESHVEVPGLGDYTISMNEPLKQNGYTFYQASFQEDEAGNPTMSILSVNQDPGRWEKYMGSLLITLGVIMMFYFRRRRARSGDEAIQQNGVRV